MKRNLTIAFVLATVILIMLLANHYARPAATFASNSNQVAPDFTLQDLNGRTVHLSDYRGKAVVLNFWATWCPPCRMEIPWFIDLQKQYGAQGLQVLGVSLDEGGRAVVEKFAQQRGINYPVLQGGPTVADEYGGVDALPTTFYIGRDGRVVASVAGLISHHEVEENIKAALATPAAPSQAASAAR